MPDHRNAPFSTPEPKTPRDIVRKSAGRLSRIRVHAWAARDALIDKGVADYCRCRDIPSLLPGFAARSEFGKSDSSGKSDPTDLIAHLRKALVHERALGRSGHWGYNLGRHMALAQACQAETRLRQTGNSGADTA